MAAVDELLNQLSKDEKKPQGVTPGQVLSVISSPETTGVVIRTQLSTHPIPIFNPHSPYLILTRLIILVSTMRPFGKYLTT